MGIFKTDTEKKEEYIKKGLDLANNNEYEKSVKEFENALKLFPKDEDALFNLGFIYSDIQQFGPAYDIFKKLININPHHIEAFNNLGLLFARQGKYGDAVFVYEKGVEHNPLAAVLFNNLGNVYYDTGKYEKALQMFKKAGELDPVFSERLYHLGIDAFIKGSGDSMDEAITKLQESAKQNVNKAKTVHDLGVAYTERHMEDKAIESFNKAINIDPNYLSAYTNLGYIYQHKEQYEKAIQSFEKAIILNPKSAKLYNTIGLIYDKMEKPDIAVKMYKKAVILDPTYANSHYMLGQLYQNRGNIDKSVAEFTKHIRIHEHGNMVEDAMHRIAEMKSMTFEDVKELFSLYIEEKTEGMSNHNSPAPQMEETNEKDYMKNLKDKMAEKKVTPNIAPPIVLQTLQTSIPVLAPAHITSPNQPPMSPKVIDPNDYMKLMKEKMRKKMAGETESGVMSGAVVPQIKIALEPPPPIYHEPPPVHITVPLPVLEVINDDSTGPEIIDLPPRPEDNPWENQRVIETTIDAPAADNEYKHSQEIQVNTIFDTGATKLPDDNFMETIIKPVSDGVLATDKIPEFKKQPRPMPVIPVEPTHGYSVQPIGEISSIHSSGAAAMAPRHPMSPAQQKPSEKDTNRDKNDDDSKPKITRNYY